MCVSLYITQYYINDTYIVLYITVLSLCFTIFVSDMSDLMEGHMSTLIRSINTQVRIIWTHSLFKLHAVMCVCYLYYDVYYYFIEH